MGGHVLTGLSFCPHTPSPNTQPDGLAIDEEGNLVVAHVGLGAVWLFSNRGEPMLRINSPLGHLTTNIAFGGPQREVLYITESESGSILTAPMPGRKMYSGV
jgi:gluconolactonase